MLKLHFPIPSFLFLLLIGLVQCNGSSEFGQEPPEGMKGEKAESLANEMLEAIDHEAWDSTKWVRWSFTGHHFVWDKERHLVRVKWGNKKVLLDPDRIDGLAYKRGEKLEGKKKEKAIEKAWEFFINDSYWLSAPAKIFQKGTERELVLTEGGDERLLVTYTSGGVTPGDSYLWKLDSNALPQSYRMWVSIIPIGGMKASWEGWEELSTGAMIATEHRMSIFTLKVKDLKAAQELDAIGLEEDPFDELQ